MNSKNTQIKIYPYGGLDDIQFKNIKEEIKELCTTEMAKSVVSQLKPHSDKKKIQKSLSEISEYKDALENQRAYKVPEYENIHPFLTELKVRNYVLESEAIVSIYRILKSNKDLQKATIKHNYPGNYPLLQSYCEGYFPEDSLLSEIESVYDDSGEVKENASPELRRISKGLNSAHRRMDKEFNTAVSQFRKKSILSDSEQSVRNGRRVLSVPSENKNNVRGIIHDASASGKTVFIEPEAVININNDIFELENDKRKEIYRLKKHISTLLRDIVHELPLQQKRLTNFEVIQAKAQFSNSLHAEEPEVSSENSFHIKNAFHPTLYLKNLRESEKTVPFSLKLDSNTRILLLSGPNAGGKSVLLKAVGLLQVMVQSGLHVPVDKDSKFMIFEKIFSDIGDHQSVDDDLSTYSSHLKTMRLALKYADSDSLLLFDEFGTGTDPRLGGAIAEGILKELGESKSIGILTTHYGNLKSFAHDKKYIKNGAMLFDKQALNPTYQFSDGKPGSSFTFEIATKAGLPKKVLKYARKNAGYDQVKIDELLTDLQKQKQDLQSERLNIVEKEKQLETLKKTYDHLQEELNIRRKRMKMDKREKKLRSKGGYSQKLEDLIKELQEERNLEKAKKAKKKLEEKQRKEIEEIAEMEEEISREYTEKHGPIKKDDYVKLRNSDTTAQVLDIDGSTAHVLMGSLKMTVPLNKLRHAGEPMEEQSSISNIKIKHNRNVHKKIDIRGLDKNESQDILEKFLDDAIMNDLDQLEIIHGKGSGVLKKIVHRKLKEYKAVSDYYHPDRQQGGHGVTLVQLK